MPKLNFIHPDGRAESVDVSVGDSVMSAAMRHGINEIVAECAGSAVCATCHVYVDDDWIARTGSVSADEDELLEGVATDRLPNSRLSCQIKVTEALDGLVLRLPERQF